MCLIESILLVPEVVGPCTGFVEGGVLHAFNARLMPASAPS